MRILMLFLIQILKYEKTSTDFISIPKTVHGLLAVGLFAVGQFAVKKMLVSARLGLVRSNNVKLG